MTRRSPDDPISAADPLDRNRFPIDEWKFTEADYSADDLGVTEIAVRRRATVTWACGATSRRAGRPTPTAPSSTASTKRGRSGMPRRPSASRGSGQTIVNVPDNKTIKLYVDDEPMLLSVADLESYERSLDFRDGLLRRDIIWRTPGGKRVKVSLHADGLVHPAAPGDHDHGGHDAG